MKPFKFRLQSVLTLRLRDEDRAREACAAAARKQAEAADAVDTGRAELDGCHTALADRRAGATNRAEQLMFLNAIRHQQSHCEQLAARSAEAARITAAQRDELLATRRKREALSRLRDNQRTAHHIEQERREEAAIADIIGARHVLNMQEVQP